MIDNEKYLYWFNMKNPLFEKEIVWREMYSRIGYAFHVIQMVEYNIANILAIEEFEKETKTSFTYEDIDRIRKNIDAKFEELSERTFGQIAGELKQSKYPSSLDLNQVKRLVDYRNYLAHHCFKEKLLQGSLNTIEEVDAFVDELNQFETEIVALNEQLIPVFNEKKIQTMFMKVS